MTGKQFDELKKLLSDLGVRVAEKPVLRNNFKNGKEPMAIKIICPQFSAILPLASDKEIAEEAKRCEEAFKKAEEKAKKDVAKIQETQTTSRKKPFVGFGEIKKQEKPK